MDYSCFYKLASFLKHFYCNTNPPRPPNMSNLPSIQQRPPPPQTPLRINFFPPNDMHMKNYCFHNSFNAIIIIINVIICSAKNQQSNKKTSVSSLMLPFHVHVSIYYCLLAASSPLGSPGRMRIKPQRKQKEPVFFQHVLITFRFGPRHKRQCRKPKRAKRIFGDYALRNEIIVLCGNRSLGEWGNVTFLFEFI